MHPLVKNYVAVALVLGLVCLSCSAVLAPVLVAGGPESPSPTPFVVATVPLNQSSDILEPELTGPPYLPSQATRI